MTLNEFVERSKTLEHTVAQIQQGQSIGLSLEEIQVFVEQYHIWFAEALDSLPVDLKDRFRTEYEGGKLITKIRRFLEQSTETNFLYSAPALGQKEVLPYWLTPYETNFRRPLLAQRQILIEASRRTVQIFSIPSTAQKENQFELHSRLHLRLYDTLSGDKFDMEDLEDLCYRLGADWDNLEGETKKARARSITKYFVKQNKLAELRQMIIQVRPAARQDIDE